MNTETPASLGNDFFILPHGKTKNNLKPGLLKTNRFCLAVTAVVLALFAVCVLVLTVCVFYFSGKIFS